MRTRARAGPFALALAALALLPAAAAAQASVQRLYADAVAKESAVRKALADPQVSATALKAVRTVVGDYETVVRRYPTSGYCDDALWRAGQLSLDAFRQFGAARDRTAGLRLLRLLASEYPTSKFAKLAPAIVAGVMAAGERPPDVGQAAQGPRDTPIATIKEIRRTVLTDAVRITIELDREVTYHDERLADPLRVFVDLPFTRAAPELVDRTLRFESDADVVRQVRIGRHPNDTTRVVIDAVDISSYSVYPLYNPYRLVIDCVRPLPASASRADVSVQPAPAGPAPLDTPAVAPGSEPAPPVEVATAGPPPGRAPDSESPPPAAPAQPVTASVPPAPSKPPAKNLAGGFSMSRQLGLGVSRIVVDPGHGGQDPGALGKGVTEASLVLDIALRLEKLLAMVPGIEVILTRRTDEYVPLQERTAIANREGADLFLSIHANASSNVRASGIETYFLNFATTASAAAIAARENAASGQAMGALPDFVKAIALNNKLDESRDFATYVQRAMIERLNASNTSAGNLGVKQAPFVVLIGAAMPSVLAEISFITNAQDVRQLRSTLYRQRIAEALFNGIRKYQASLKNVEKVAQQ